MSKLTDIAADFIKKTSYSGETEKAEKPKIESVSIELDTIMNGENELYGRVIFTKEDKETSAVYFRKVANPNNILDFLDNMPLARLIEKAAVDQGYKFYLTPGYMFGELSAIAIVVANEKPKYNKFSRFVTDLDKHIRTYLSL